MRVRLDGEDSSIVPDTLRLPGEHGNTGEDSCGVPGTDGWGVLGTDDR